VRRIVLRAVAGGYLRFLLGIEILVDWKLIERMPQLMSSFVEFIDVPHLLRIFRTNLLIPCATRTANTHRNVRSCK